jgi:hypothetical protein
MRLRSKISTQLLAHHDSSSRSVKTHANSGYRLHHLAFGGYRHREGRLCDDKIGEAVLELLAMLVRRVLGEAADLVSMFILGRGGKGKNSELGCSF